MSELVALIDMDGTLCDYNGAMARDLETLRSPGEERGENPWGVGAPDWLKARRELIKAQSGWWETLEELPAGMHIYRTLERYGFKSHVLTKGPYNSPNAWTEKANWCRSHLRRNIPITITMDKGLVYGKILVDDYPLYVFRWLEWRPRGLVICPAQPWNEGIDSHPNIIRYSFLDNVGCGLTKGEKELYDAIEIVKDRKDGEDLKLGV